MNTTTSNQGGGDPLAKYAPLTQYDYQFFILVTGFSDSGEDVLIHACRLRAEDVEQALKRKGATYIECYEIPEGEIGFYIYEPLFCTGKMEDIILAANELERRGG